MRLSELQNKTVINVIDGKNIGSRTLREEKDYKAELEKRKMNNLAQSMIANI